MTEEQRKATLRDGQEVGELLLDIEARIGELLPEAEKAMKTPSRRPEGVSKNRANAARAIAKHPDMVERVKAQARENENIPTRTAVINGIPRQVEKERRTSTPSKTRGELSLMGTGKLANTSFLEEEYCPNYEVFNNNLRFSLKNMRANG